MLGFIEAQTAVKQRSMYVALNLQSSKRPPGGNNCGYKQTFSCKQVYRQMTPGFLYQMNLVKSTRTQTDDFKNGTSQTNVKVWLLPSFICSL